MFIPVGGEGALHNFSFAGTGVYKRTAADIDRRMIDALACFAVEEQEITAFQIIDGIDSCPAVVFRVRMCAAAADRYARLFRQ